MSNTERGKAIARAKQDLTSFTGKYKSQGRNAVDSHPIDYVPEIALEDFWTPGRLLDILCAGGDNERIATDANTIKAKYLVVFSVLVLMSRPELIGQFTAAGLDDAHLPLSGKPHCWTEDTQVGEWIYEFMKLHWKYCPLALGRHLFKLQVDPNRIIPISEQKRLRRCATAQSRENDRPDDVEVYKVDLCMHSGIYNSKWAVFKTYISQDPDVINLYNNEVDLYSSIPENSDAFHHIIRYYGSFEQQGSRTIVLEFAERGDLESIFSKLPPVRHERIYFWNGFFGLFKGLDAIHNLTPLDNLRGSWSLKGLHQDIRPPNIVICSQGPENTTSDYKGTFKFTDFGSGHVRKTRNQGVDRMGSHRVGDDWYAAPETVGKEESDQTAIPESDVWSLGCVASEALIWSIGGKEALDQYRRARENATPKDGWYEGAFHDGSCLLKEVLAFHQKTLKDVPMNDISHHVSNIILETMLVADYRRRFDAKGVLARWQTVLEFFKHPSSPPFGNIRITSGISGTSYANPSTAGPDEMPPSWQLPSQIDSYSSSPTTLSPNKLREASRQSHQHPSRPPDPSLSHLCRGCDSQQYLNENGRDSGPRQTFGKRYSYDSASGLSNVDRHPEAAPNCRNPLQLLPISPVTSSKGSPLEFFGSPPQIRQSFGTPAQSPVQLPPNITTRSVDEHFGLSPEVQGKPARHSMDASLSDDGDKWSSYPEPPRGQLKAPGYYGSTIDSPQLTGPTLWTTTHQRPGSVLVAIPPEAIWPNPITVDMIYLQCILPKVLARGILGHLSFLFSSRTGTNPLHIFPEVEKSLSRLKGYNGRNQIFLVDDLRIMSKHKEEIGKTVRVLAYCLKKGKVDPDVKQELYYASNVSASTGSVSGDSSDLQDSVLQHTFDNDSLDIATSLHNIVSNVKKSKACCSIYVLTNGYWNNRDPKDLCGVDGVVHRVIKWVEEAGIDPNWVGIQFIRFHNRADAVINEIGRRRLKVLDDMFRDQHEPWKDIIDTRDWDDHVPKILLGSVFRDVDEED